MAIYLNNNEPFDIWTLDFFLGALQAKLKSYRGRLVDLSQCTDGVQLLSQCRDAGIKGKLVAGSRPYLWIQGSKRSIKVYLPKTEENRSKLVGNRL